MKRWTRPATRAALLLMALLAASGCGESAPAPETLVKLAPKISDAGDLFRRVDVRGSFVNAQTGVEFDFHLLSTGPDAAGYLVDRATGAPLMSIAGETTVIYDALTDSLIVLRGTRPMLKLEQGEQAVLLNFSPDLLPAGQGSPMALSLDFPAVLAAHDQQRRVSRIKGSVYELAGSSGAGTNVRFTINPDDRSPYERMAYERTGQKESIEIHTLLLHDEVSYRIRPLPDFKMMQTQFRVTEMTFKPDADRQAREQSLDAVFARVPATVSILWALRHPERRGELQKRAPNFNWIEAEKVLPGSLEKLKRLILLPGPAQGLN